jgi:hypothetical protein
MTAFRLGNECHILDPFDPDFHFKRPLEDRRG